MECEILSFDENINNNFVFMFFVIWVIYYLALVHDIQRSFSEASFKQNRSIKKIKQHK